MSPRTVYKTSLTQKQDLHLTQPEFKNVNNYVGGILNNLVSFLESSWIIFLSTSNTYYKVEQQEPSGAVY